jgi:hypothetical protein
VNKGQERGDVRWEEEEEEEEEEAEEEGRQGGGGWYMSRWRRRERREATCLPCIVVLCRPGQCSATASACSSAALQPSMRAGIRLYTLACGAVGAGGLLTCA